MGHYIQDNKKKNWDKVAEVPREYIWLHGPRVTKTRLRAYVKFMIRECKLDAESIEEGSNASRTQPVQGTTGHTLLGRIKACQTAARVEATLYREKELSIMREISVVRSEVRFMVRTKNERDVKNCADRLRGTVGDTYTAEQFRQIMTKVPPTWAASAWNPRATAPSQTLWRFLLTKALTLLSHHTLLRGASIREITLSNIFLYRLASTSSVSPENQPVVMVIAARNSKTSKDARLQQSYAARHLEAELCAVGETGLWLHFILDQIDQFNGVDFLPPLDTTDRERWCKKHLFFARNDKEQKELSAASHQHARRMPAAPPSGNEQAPSESGSADSASTGARAKKRDEKPPKPPVTVNEACYELNVVQPWREAKTVRDAWCLWNSATADDTRRLCDRVAEPGFVDRHTLLKGAMQGPHGMKVRRMLKAMDAVRLLRSSNGDADTEVVVAALNKIAAPGIGTFCDALTVLKPGTASTKSKEPGMGVKGLGPKSVSKLRLACALVALNLKPSAWVAVLCPDI
ncbi:unnamed protein product [Closterium sp. Naga37s-1]|nr:unnamed protein product [Closterium sp. Naga37s-1]